MMGRTKANGLHRAAWVAVIAVSFACLPGTFAQKRQSPPPRPAPAPRQQQRQNGAARQAGRGQYAAPSQPARAQNYGNPQRGQVYNQTAPARQTYPTQHYFAPQPTRPEYPGNRPGNFAPPGHLQSWLNQRRNVPVANQEQMLRSDPSFRRLPQGEQQRLVQQLQHVDNLSEQQRQRRLERAENLERLSPQERMRVNRSAEEWRTLPPERQSLMRNAFRDLRAVPPDQRSIVLNSARYQGQFSPQERGILSDMLRVEPYEVPK